MLNTNRAGTILLIAAALSLSGCVGHRTLAANAVSLNKAVEEAQNEMLLLNAIRASRRRPMYVTGISKLTGSVRRDLSAPFKIPYGGKAMENSVNPSIGYTVSPSFDVPVLDTQEFMQGFLAPVSHKTLAYYWDQGWPKPLLLHLLVQKVVVRSEKKFTAEDGKEKIRVKEYHFDNYPDVRDENLCQQRKFSRFVDFYLDPKNGDPQFETRTSTRDIGPLLFRKEIGQMEDLVAASKEGFEVIESGSQYRLRRRESTLALVVQDLNGLERIRRFAQKEKRSRCKEGQPEKGIVRIVKDDPGSEKPDDKQVTFETGSESIEPEKVLTTYSQESKTDDDDNGADVSIQFIIRSPEGVLYYLGQIIRFEEEWGLVPEVCIQGRWQPVFVGRGTSLDCADGAVSVTYENKRYLIPADPGEDARKACKTGDTPPAPVPLSCAAGRSMQALSLLNQIIAIQKSAKDQPGTSVVRTIPQ